MHCNGLGPPFLCPARQQVLDSPPDRLDMLLSPSRPHVIHEGFEHVGMLIVGRKARVLDRTLPCLFKMRPIE